MNGVAGRSEHADVVCDACGVGRHLLNVSGVVGPKIAWRTRSAAQLLVR